MAAHWIAPFTRFWQKVSVDAQSGCWLWTSAREYGGYPILWLGDGKSVRAHRYAYEMLVGPIPTGLGLDHLCRVRHCVNPAHLEPVTAKENSRRAIPYNPKGTRTTCMPGLHAFTPENTAIHHGRRRCRACAAAYAQARRLANKVAA